MFTLDRQAIQAWIKDNVDIEDTYDYLHRTQRLKSLNESEIDDEATFDVFLSHSYHDRDLVIGIKALFEKEGFTVYVDWINDKLLSRDNVTKDTAAVLQKRMRQSKCLIYATSENASQSKWMPWETGFFDGIRDRMVAILPISENASSDFSGQEYLGLYPYIALDSLDKSILGTPMLMEPTAFERMMNDFKKIYKLYVFKDKYAFILFSDWIEGEKPITPKETMEKQLDKIHELTKSNFK